MFRHLGWALVCHSVKFRHFPNISQFPKFLNPRFSQFVKQLVYTMLISNNLQSFHLWWKENLVKHRKISKYDETDYFHDILLLFVFLLTTNFVKNNHSYARIFFFFWKLTYNKLEMILIQNLDVSEKIGKGVIK